jgi:autotransporter-associated beta strand protein
VASATASKSNKKDAFMMRIALLTTSALVAISASVAHAADATWTGATNTDYGNSSNWTPNGAPTGTATFDNTAARQSVELNADQTVDGWTFNGGSYGFTNTGHALTFTGAGIVQNGGAVAITGDTTFTNSSTAGNATLMGGATFSGNSTGGNAAIAGSSGILSNVDLSATSGLNGDHKVSVGSLDGLLNVNIGANQLTLGGNNQSTTLLGGFGVHSSITDNGAGGSLVKVGTGIFSVDGTVSLSGGITVSQGFLQILDNAVIDSNIKNDAIGPNAGLAFTQTKVGGPFQYFGVISGSGQVVKTGPFSSILSLMGNNTYTGPTVVIGGFLDVEGSIASSSLTTVRQGTVLLGSGTVGNTVIQSSGGFQPGVGALIATPGASMTVNGNLRLESGSGYFVNVFPTVSNSAHVTGTATLGGAQVVATYAPGDYIAKRYTILTAGSVDGTFSSIDNEGLPAGFFASLSYDATHAFLNLSLGLDFGDSLNGNQGNLANALINFFNVNGGIPGAFGTLTPAVLTQISGEGATGSQQATFDAMKQFMGVLTDPFIDGRGEVAAASGGSAGYADERAALAYAAKGATGSKSERDAYATMARKAPTADTFIGRWSVWAAGYGGSQTTDGNAAAGSNATTSRIFGTAVGADYRFSANTIAGFALGGGGTNFNVANGLGGGRSDLFQAGAFVKHTNGPAYVTAALAYGWQDVTTDRTLTIAGRDQLRAEFNANAWSGRVEGGYRFITPTLGGVGLTPYAAAQATMFDLPAYAETAVVGANTFALSYDAKNVTATRSELGLRSDKSYAMSNGILTLRGRAAWAHDFNSDRSAVATFQTLPGATFTVNGALPAPDAALTTASVEMKWQNGWSTVASFEGEFSNVTRSYAGKGAVRYAW